MNPKKIIQFSIGPLGGAFLGLVSLPIITWFFSQEDIGRISMLQVTLSFTTLLFSFGLDQSYVREFHESTQKPKLFKNALIPGTVFLVLASIVALINGDMLSLWLFDTPSRALTYFTLLMVLATFLSRFMSLILRMNERGIAFSLSQLLPKLLLLILVGLYVLLDLDKSLLNLVVAYAASATFVCFLLIWNTRDTLRESISTSIDVNQLKGMLAFGFPLIWGGIAFWGLTAIDKVLIRMLSSYEELGLYSVSVSFATAATIIQTVFSTIWAPTVYKWVSEGKGTEAVSNVTRYILLCVVVVFSVAGMFSWIVPLLLPKEYESVQWILIACLGYPLLYTLSETTVVGIGVSKKSSFAMLASIVAFLVNIVGNYLLIPEFGAAGAAASTCIAFYIFLIARTEFSILLWKPIPRKAIYIYSTLLVFGAVTSAIFKKEYHYELYLFWSLMLLSSFYVFRKDYKNLFLNIRILIEKRRAKAI